MKRTLTLFDDQAELMGKISRKMRESKSILVQSPTGSGKTAMATYMILKSVQKAAELAKLKDKKIIFTVPRKDLLEQTSESFFSYGIDHSYIASGKEQNPFSKVYLGMVDTMGNRIKLDEEGRIVKADLPQGYIVIIDETHFGAGSLEKIINFYKAQGAWVLGLSATPCRLSGKGLGDWYNTMVQGKSVEWLIENKRLSDYDYYYGKRKPDLSNIKVAAGDYNKKQLGEFMEEQNFIISDCVDDYISRCMGRLHIVRCASIKHSEMMAERFRDAGVTAVHVDGNTPMDIRKRIFKAYARREIKVLTFCDLLNFGFDLSQASGGMDVCIESGSDMKPTKSLAAQMQFWGRMLRYKDYPAIINDHVNNYEEHGLPCSDRKWTLEGRKQRKRNTEPVPPTRQCAKCYFVHTPAPVCPRCGYVYPVNSREIEEVDGTLEKLDKEKAREIKEKAKFARKKKIYEAKTLRELIQLGREFGYKYPSKWAASIMAARMAKEEVRNAKRQARG